jgi:DNA-binding protein HU-beta
MSKSQFIANVAESGDMSNAEAKRVVELVFGEIEKGLKKAKKDGKYTIGTFGTFTITKRPARKGRNPRTGEEIKIKASKSLRFRPASNLKVAAGTAK